MKNLLILLIIFTASKAIATEQAPDFLLYKGEKLALHVNPLEEYFEKHPERRLQDRPFSTGLWRGYVATFEFKENTLTVKYMVIPDWIGAERKEYSVIEKYLPNINERKLTWYSGLLVIPVGEMKTYAHLSYASEYENYLLLKVTNGKLVKSKKLTLKEYREFKYKMFQRYKETDEYKQQHERLSKNSEDDSDIEEFLYLMGDFYQYIDVDL